MEQIDNYLKELMATPQFREAVTKDLDFNSPVTLTYGLERLLITHCKLWMLEDQVRDTKLSDEEIGVLKRKIDYFNGIVRPRLVAALGDIFAKAVKEGNEELVREPNLKDYKAR